MIIAKDDVQDLKNENIRSKVINALISDNKTRYAGVSSPQKTGRFNIPKKCIEALRPEFGDSLHVIEDNNTPTGIIIAKKPAREDEDKVLSRVRFGTGQKEEKRRLRLNQNVAKTFGACDIGVSIFSYNGDLALRVSPKVPDPDINIYKARTIEEFGRYILWPGRTIKFISFAGEGMMFGDEFSFKLLGGMFIIKKHISLEGESVVCKVKECDNCGSAGKFPLTYFAAYFPVLCNIINGPSRPAMMKFVNKGMPVCLPLIKDTLSYHEKTKTNYWSGPVDYEGIVWKAANDYRKNKVCISEIGVERKLTDAERGWLLTMRKEFRNIISAKEAVSRSSVI